MRTNNFDNKKYFFEFVNEFASEIFLKLKISIIQLNFIVFAIIKFEFTMSIREFRLSDLYESHLIITKFVDFGYFDNENVDEDSI